MRERLDESIALATTLRWLVDRPNVLIKIPATKEGLGAIEACLSAGLTAAGMPGAAAGSAVLLYRLLTFWLPVPVGWVALKYLERRQVL